MLLHSSKVRAFAPKRQRHVGLATRHRSSPTTPPLQLALTPLAPDDQALAFWVFSFSTLHIGMSAIRDRLIDACGQAAASLNLIDRKLIQLPSYWPGDDVGKDQVFPDKKTAGRQIYRAIYTFVSFATLLSALSAYLSSTADSAPVSLSEAQYNALFWMASAASGASIASLFNASPLSLMPGFEQASAEDASVPIIRNDSLKFTPRGLTRITRHPLILPVVPWGIANSVIAGGRVADFLLFGGLALYSIAGCMAQDLRVIRKEGSVGTTFRPDESLQDFFQQTSFVPFGAVLDGRQSIQSVVREVPWIAFAGGCLVGAGIESAMLEWLLDVAS